MSTKSSALAVHPIHGMLYGALRQYVIDRRNDVEPTALWAALSEDQKVWLDILNKIDPSYRAVLGKRIKTFGSESCDDCNDFLAEEGFSIKLQPFVGDSPVGGVCTMHVGVEWAYAGEETTLYRYNEKTGESETFDAAQLGNGGLTYLKSPSHQYPIVKIATKGPETVFMTVADKELNGLALLDRVMELDSTAKAYEHAYWEGLIFPMVDLDVEPDVSQLCGMYLPRKAGKPYTLFQALAQVKFKANHLGAQTDAAAAGQMGIESGPQYVELEKPFFVWKKIPGLTHPVLVAYVAEDSWKNPGQFEINNG